MKAGFFPGMLWGAALAAVNVALLAWSLRLAGTRSAQRALAVRFLVRYAVVGAAAWLLVTRCAVNLVGLAAGFAIVFLALAAAPVLFKLK